MNHIHISTLLQNQPVSDEVSIAACQMLGDIWRRTLDDYLTVESGGTCLHDAHVTFFDGEKDAP